MHFCESVVHSQKSLMSISEKIYNFQYVLYMPNHKEALCYMTLSQLPLLTNV